ncbi:uncharacterized protein LY89DRAFT_709299 [Mollisia scopiformis]|uniref:Laccase n=1 Tax=Mollisia scopiformis TaxID=149040 RepID=A0A194X094_MOLSC|nr:uncharacterized protein LY89DRAFT_709299 [Mollisia scopiformis]KUJ13615.1 hypothetical protein LY89DRAFT_709299 [Mollisia scopiformis]
MRLTYLRLGALLLAPFITAQVDYPNLSVPYLFTSDPVTPLPQGFPWGTRTANNTNPRKTLDDPPPTGVIRRYDFTIQRSKIAPDGYLKKVLLINGQFPGPQIEANWGDTIQVTVRNEITNPEEGTALHWHGILQRTSQWFDGVPSVQQCPIPPGGTFTYTFLADSYGTSWYHSHYSAQYAGGLFGPLVIHGPETVPYDIDVGPVFVTDYYHQDYFSIVEDLFSSDFGVVAVPGDNSFINGRNPFNCSTKAINDTTPCFNNAPRSKFKFTAGKKHRLRLINAGASALQKFSIDGHNLTIIANDFTPVIPYETQFVTIAVGQRTDIIVEGLPGATGSYWARSASPQGACANTNEPNATAIVYYENEYTPDTTPWPIFEESIQICANDDLTETVPWYSLATPPSPATTKEILIDLVQNETGSFLFTMNNVSFRGDFNAPILLLSNQGNNSYPEDPQWNVYNFGSNDSTRIILNNNNPEPTQCICMRRDTQLVPGYGYLVISFFADNPGAWPLHCHVAWHVSNGLYVTVLERPDDIANLQIPSVLAQTCRDWGAYTNTTVVDQIDSGL